VTVTDANGATGGVGSYLYILAESPPVSACNPVALTPSALSLTVDGDGSQCASMDVTVTGGTPPYTFTAVQQDTESKVVTYSTGNFVYVLDIGTGKNVTFAVTDSKGLGAVGTQFIVGSSPDTSCLTLASTLLPLDPGLTSVYQGLAAPVTASVSSTGNGVVPAPTFTSASSGSHKNVSIAAVAGGAVGGLALLLLAGIAGALWQRKKQRAQHAQNVDLADAMGPASEPATGDAMLPPRPYSFDQSTGQPFMSEVSNPGFAGMGVPRGRNEKSPVAPVQPRRGSSFYENFPVTPPYSAADSEEANTHTGSSSTAPLHPMNRRYSGISDMKSDGVSEQDMMAVSRLSSPSISASHPRAGSPPLPPGAAAPNTFSMLGMVRPPQARGDEEAAQGFAYLPNASRSPPPTYS
ncbi:hypothetical protein FRB97_003515, partial [Tulasnella sp. 331]